MEPISQTLASVGLKTAMSAAIRHAWQGVTSSLADEQVRATPRAPYGPIQEDTQLEEIFRRTAENVARAAARSDRAHEERLSAALTSPEAEGIVRRVFAVNVLPDYDDVSLEELRGHFSVVLQRFVGDISAAEADFLFDGLVASCQRVLSVALQRGNIGALDARVGHRFRRLRDELAALRLAIDSLSARDTAGIDAVLRFEVEYRSEVGKRHSTITPPHLSEHDRVQLDALFVPPLLTLSNSAKNAVRRARIRSKGSVGDPKTVQVGEFLSCTYRSVVLGTPGGGKSTLAAKICYDLATNYNARLVGGRALTPVFVLVKEYGADNKDKKLSILQHIEATAAATYQLTPPRGAFEYLLAAGRLFVVFDGLDELLDTTFRRKVTSDIESFSRQYPSAPLLVTAREVGYSEAPLDAEIFDEYRLAPFSPAQVTAYANKWFRLAREAAPERNAERAAAFLRESAGVPDLRSNPLMLGLICNIYREENYIPENRPEVYRKCAEMLFDRWDRHRAIPVRFHYDLQLRPVLAHLAYWLYTSEATKGVTERQLVARAADYHAPKIGDRDKAQALAKAFVEFCRGRAWVFTDQGTTAKGERLYQFTHRTFLEYFTALHLHRTYEKTDELVSFLLPRIASGEWGIVPVLTCHIRSSESDNAANTILRTVLDAASTSVGSRQRSRLLTLASQALTFMTVDADLARAAIHEIVEAAVLDTTSSLTTQPWEVDRSEPETVVDLMGPLLTVSEDKLGLVSKEIRKVVDGQIAAPQIEDGEIAAAGLGCELTGLFKRSGRHGRKPKRSTHWEAQERAFVTENLNLLRRIAQRKVELALELFWRGAISVDELIDNHGALSLFSARQYIVQRRIQQVSPAELLVDLLSSPRRFPGFFAPAIVPQDVVRQCGVLLGKLEAPWIVTRRRPVLSSPPSERGSPCLGERLSPAETFGVFTLAAPLTEAANRKPVRADKARQVALFTEGVLGTSLLARLTDVRSDAAADEIRSLGLAPEHASLMENWMSRRVNFVKWSATAPEIEW